MAIIKEPHLFNEQNLFVDLGDMLGRVLYLKIEGSGVQQESAAARTLPGEV